MALTLQAGKTMNEKMPCSITDGPQYDDQFDGDIDETKCVACQEVAVQHPGLCEECRVTQAEADKGH